MSGSEYDLLQKVITRGADEDMMDFDLDFSKADISDGSEYPILNGLPSSEGMPAVLKPFSFSSNLTLISRVEILVLPVILRRL